MSELRTERLLLRRFTEDDLDHLLDLDSDPEVLRWAEPNLGGATPENRRPVLDAILAGYEQGEEFWAAEEDGVFVGWFFLKEQELGYRLKQSAWGRGLATEGGRAVIAYGFETLALPLIYAEVFQGNHRSLKVMAKLGLTHVSDSVWEGLPDSRFEIHRP